MPLKLKYCPLNIEYNDNVIKIVLYNGQQHIRYVI